MAEARRAWRRGGPVNRQFLRTDGENDTIAWLRRETKVSVVRLSDEAFETLVVDVLDNLPEEILKMLDNVDVVIEDRPTRAQLEEADLDDDGTLYGLYEGIPLTARDGGYFLIAPDKITIFKRPIEEDCDSLDEIAEQVRITVIHEVAHHFGIGEERIAELGWA
jgi:predicted Zn-dependent protease with MMP-like domain